MQMQFKLIGKLLKLENVLEFCTFYHLQPIQFIEFLELKLKQKTKKESTNGYFFETKKYVPALLVKKIKQFAKEYKQVCQRNLYCKFCNSPFIAVQNGKKVCIACGNPNNDSVN